MPVSHRVRQHGAAGHQLHARIDDATTLVQLRRAVRDRRGYQRAEAASYGAIETCTGRDGEPVLCATPSAPPQTERILLGLLGILLGSLQVETLSALVG